MKHIVIPQLVCAVIVVVSVVNACGQERVITEKEFWTVQAVPMEKLPVRAYGMIQNGEQFDEKDGSKKSSSASSMDIIYPNKSRVVTKSVTEKGTRVWEIIWAAGWIYERIDSGAWTRTRSKLPDIKEFGSLGKDPDPGPEPTCKFVGKTTIDGKQLSIYERSVENRFGSGKNQMIWNSSIRVWIDDDGFPVKALRESKNLKGVVRSRETTLYDYVTPITIDAPKMKGTNKRAARRNENI